ncbi:hypothetical protein QRO11_21660 [Paracidovorax citrulli]|uniref:hypothetical protein n=1 Tax=Paracidovorax citrulli TaxID=80869 RepID=UPI0002FE6CEE|nr:hypothetical protein [Paracidovorax citrulli]QCX10966.1 hypothetical protein APS58_2130 [Paracidovorax citrulli]UEG46063.1 hypothetical protein LKW27_20835 [Paracidovorax citrulli]UMT86643.1 hypothetical protein FRC90_00435 [Paracidovorax citrulli]UMT94685.1 hypothetical protein FRC97_06620 [Paracidovorax citrulli]WIY34519.1 hypothetical protein QRO11_21660 [Paracidovorax citrulli]
MRTKDIPFLRPGMYVRSRNGNTRMLVTCDNGDGSVICFWFCEEGDRLVWQRFAGGDLCPDLQPGLQPPPGKKAPPCRGNHARPASA